jgi:alcohol dehydrogenase class IV
LEVAHAVETAGAVGGVVDAGLAGLVAGHALPVAVGDHSDSAGGTDLVAVALVHVVVVLAVVADQVLSALEAALGTALADCAQRSEAVVAVDLASGVLQQKRSDA